MNLQDVYNLMEQQRQTGQDAFSFANQYGKYIMEYVREVDDTAVSIFSSVSDEQILAAVSILIGAVATDQIKKGTISQNELQFLLSKQFHDCAGLMFKLAVGIAAQEELR